MTWLRHPHPANTGRFLRFYVLVAILCGIATHADPALAIDYPGAVRTPQLEVRLPTHDRVFCTRNTSWSFAMIDDREIYLGEQECDALLGRDSDQSFELAVHVLYHEWWHVAFHETNEKLTECGAYAVTPWLLVHYWHETQKVARRQAALAFKFASPYDPLPCR